MRRSVRVTAVSVSLVALVLVSVTGCDPTARPTTRAPRTGVVTDIIIDARACYDQDVKTVLIQYQPAGTDMIGDPWPQTMFCTTPEIARRLTVGSQVTQPLGTKPITR